jgi:hypothetical protein
MVGCLSECCRSCYCVWGRILKRWDVMVSDYWEIILRVYGLGMDA